ncbi:MAG: helix-turn-helix domain-containing protein [Bacillota bacterium]
MEGMTRTPAGRARRPGGSGERYLTPRDVAEMLDVTEQAVRAWCERGLIDAIQPAGHKGVWRIPASQFAVSPEQLRDIVEKIRAINRRLGYGETDDHER